MHSRKGKEILIKNGRWVGFVQNRRTWEISYRKVGGGNSHIE
jgi:hypothetical protein